MICYGELKDLQHVYGKSLSLSHSHTYEKENETK